MDRIEKQILLRASKSRVWSAITDSEQFGKWFGVRFNGPFEAGKPLRGAITPTTVDEDVAKAQKAYEGKSFEIEVDRIEPERLFSFRWHPYAIDPAVDYSQETPTTVTFSLEEKPDGILLTITESGFDQLPTARRAEALKMNEGGWNAQAILIEKYLAQI